MSSPEAVEIRSYRTVFDLERRIYRIDRLRLNPTGIPVRGVMYFLLAVLLVLTLGALPVTRTITGLFPWYLRDIGFPAGLAALLSIIRVEGRPFHRTAVSLARYAVGPRQFSGLRPCEPLGRRWHPEPLLFLPDGSDSRLRSLRFTGPGVALVSVAHERAVWQTTLPGTRTHLTLRSLSSSGNRPVRGQVIELRAGVRLHVHGAPPTQRRVRGKFPRKDTIHGGRGHTSPTRRSAGTPDCVHQTHQRSRPRADRSHG
jgi:hypothetical protein